jgi:Fe(3+) dicitrate transport protein
MRFWLTSSCLLFVVSTTTPTAAQEAEPVDDEPYIEDADIEDADFDDAAWGVSAFDGADPSRVAGSAHKLDEEDLERFEDDNIEKPLLRTPGVYVRGEDGYGLRPNIGLRGGSSERSKKVTLMEDGVLFGPAPYSAPAAYYFPLVTRMTSLEVFKGPSGLRHGPNTIGGAINMTTRAIPHGHRFGADLAAGNELYGKAHGHYGYGTDRWGVLIEGVRLRSDGFKQIDGPHGRNSGFDKMEWMLKARVNTNPDKEIYNETSIKLGYAREVSRETYLGLTDEDFAATPLRRYAASALDEMRWNRYQVELAHDLVVDDDFRMHTVAYRHDFDREWNKLNAFDDADLYDMLSTRTPSVSDQVRLAILRGGDSSATDPRLLIGNNARTYVSQGIQSSASVKLPRLWEIAQSLQFGARFHNDSVRRNHTSDSFIMFGGEPRSDGAPTVTTALNEGEATALAGYLIDEISLWRFLFVPGIRVEYVFTNFEDNAGAVVESQQHAILPGMGVLFQALDEVAFLAGVHHGFSPVTPGQAAEIEPEEARNYEAGMRLSAEHAGAEVIGFYSDYEQLTPECSFGVGCTSTQVGVQANAGRAAIVGLEVVAHADIQTPIDLTVPIHMNYTLTQTELEEAFISDIPAFANVQPGDEIPYVPKHQFSAHAGLDSEAWGHLTVGGTFVAAVREQAGQGNSGLFTDPFVVFDVSALLRVTDELAVYGKVENLLNESYIVSRRPYGARPGRPRFVFGGVKINIDRP